MYSSYAVLFIIFALDRYLWPQQRSALAPRGTPKPVVSAAGGGAGTADSFGEAGVVPTKASNTHAPVTDPEPPVSGSGEGAPGAAGARQRRRKV
jgi:hypothetical protein